MRFRRLASGLFVVAVVGCAPSPQSEELRVRAAYDMKCSNREDVHVAPLGNDTYDAQGCGKRATYAWICNGHGPMAPCKWVRKSESGPAQK